MKHPTPRALVLILLTPLVIPVALARQDKLVCGTSPARDRQERFMHHQSQKARQLASSKGMKAAQGPVKNTDRDLGNIAIIDDSGGVVSHRNDFNLDHKSLVFTPTVANASSYKYQVGGDTYDATAVSSGTPINGFADDDTKAVPLPFPFIFYGINYNQIWVNSDGNVTFNEGDTSTLDRSLGRMDSGDPRISPLYEDLNPSKAPNSVSVLVAPTQVTINWTAVPEFSDTGSGSQETFQLRLYSDNHIEMSWSGIQTSGAVVGISPGGLLGTTVITDFASAPSAEYSGTVAETFGGANEVDIQLVSQRFYQTHDDSYDYLMIFNNLDVAAGSGAVSFEETQRGFGFGYGQGIFDDSSETGSAARLQSLINMGPLSQFPVDPNQLFNGNSLSTLGVMSHETGHLFLAYVSVPDPNDSTAYPMLGRQLAHWNFAFNSEASLLEGNRIADSGAGATPRFKTTDDYQQYAPLDQYLMGFRLPEEVPPTFLVINTGQDYSQRAPQTGIVIKGDRRDVTIDDIIAAAGRRVPDATVAQRRFRFAVILVSAAGKDPSPAELAQIDAYRTQFETAYRNYGDQRAWADTALLKTMHLSVAPAAGVLVGSTATGYVNIQRAASAALPVTLSSSGFVGIPQTVTIPAGATNVSFSIQGLKAGVDDLTAQPADSTYETSYARMQVSAPSSVALYVISGDEQVATPGTALPSPIQVVVTDANFLPYSGAAVQATDNSAGTVTGDTLTSATAVTDITGVATFHWTPGATAPAHLTLTVVGGNVTTMVNATGAPRVTAAAVVNAASFGAGITPGGIATIYGIYLAAGITDSQSYPWPTDLDGVEILINNTPVPVIYISDGQINFLVPATVTGPTATLAVQSSIATSAAVTVPVLPLSPGIFYDATSGYGAILNAGTTQTTTVVPAAHGSYIEIYCTGLGPVAGNATLRQTTITPQVTVGGVPATVSFSGLAPGYEGLYQIDVQVPAAVPSGAQPLVVSVNGVASNSVKVGVQ